MSVLQTINLSADAVKMRWKEPYVTAGINQKNIASHPKGVLAGFKVVPNAGFVVNVQVDPTLNLSVANILETTGGYYSVTVVQTSNVLIDLTAQANSTVFIVLDAQYTVGATSAAQVKVVDAAELSTNLDLVVLAKVNVPSVGPITAAHINLGYRGAAGDYSPEEQAPHFNLINNPSFEATTVGWTNSGFTLMTASTDTAHSASYSLKLVQAAPGFSYAVTGPMPVVPGRAYRATAWLRSTGSDPVSGGNGAKVQVGFYDAAGSQIGSWTDIEAAWTGGSTTWEMRRSEVTAPSLALTAKLRLFFDNAQGTLYLDDVEFASHKHDEVMKAAVFGGAGAVADDWHKHTALGLTYAGSPNWADGTSIAAGTIESGIDGVPGALGPTTGASKVGFLPSPGVDITVGAPGTQHVAKALNELDTKKAGLDQPNVFTKNNVITSSVANTTALSATGNGTGKGVFAQGGATGGAGVHGLGLNTTATNAHGVAGEAPSSGAGLSHTGGPFGVLGVGGDAGYGYGVVGIGESAVGGSGVVGVSNYLLSVPNVGDTGVVGKGGSAGVYGEGVTNAPGLLGSGAGTGAGVRAVGGSTAPSGTAWSSQADGTGAHAIAGVSGANGVVGVGGGTPPPVSFNAPFLSNGVLGIGAGAGAGVYGVAGSSSGSAGVYGYGGNSSGTHGVRGKSQSNLSYGGLFEGGVGESVPSGFMIVGGPGLKATGSAATNGGVSFGFFATPGVVGGAGAVIDGGQGGQSETGNAGAQAAGGPGGVAVQATGGPGAVGKPGLPLTSGISYHGGAGGVGGISLYAVGGYGGVGGDALLNGGANPASGGDGGAGSYGLYAVGGNGGNGGSAVNGGTVGVGGDGGVGIYCQGGVGGVGSVSGKDGYALEVGPGHAKFSGTNPSASTGFNNTLTPSNIVKAWCSVYGSGTTVTAISNGFNVASVTWNAGSLSFSINMAEGFAGWPAVSVTSDRPDYTMIRVGATDVAFCSGGTKVAPSGPWRMDIIVCAIQT